MSLTVFRVERLAYSATAKQGLGAYLTGARWNSSGLHAVYCSEHLSLGILEVLAHLTPKGRTSPRGYFEIVLDELAIYVVPRRHLPRSFGPMTPEHITQAIGDEWLKGKATVAMKVPSAIIPTEYNYILNPTHLDFKKAASWSKIRSIEIDRRIIIPAPASARNAR
ncbi:MAG TPA: RES family NAD+ phosphorylase [Opitutaceae bacterium]|nr:RES family NAD+ phosphorylase [Opitutaceae bacterium]